MGKGPENNYIHSFLFSFYVNSQFHMKLWFLAVTVVALVHLDNPVAFRHKFLGLAKQTFEDPSPDSHFLQRVNLCPSLRHVWRNRQVWLSKFSSVKV